MATAKKPAAKKPAAKKPAAKRISALEKLLNDTEQIQFYNLLDDLNIELPYPDADENAYW